MISADLSRRTQELAAAGIAFVTATVVRAQSPTSVEPGSVALVLGDGTIEGFVGGVCAEHSVRAYSLQALASGEAILLRILPEPVEGREIGPEGLEVASEDGAVTVQNPCLSGGAIEIFLEPVPAVPRVLVVGRTPIANAVRRIGAELALDMVGVAEDGPDPDPGDLAIVVAGHGRDELRPLRRALEAGVPYVGLVASEKRGTGVLEELRVAGVAEELLDRIDVPAGIPIGSRTAAEVAVSVLAKVVEVRRSSPPAREPAPGRAAVAVDPICGMTVAAVTGTLSVERDGETFYFCSEGCKARFEARREHVPTAG
jgi:xanthine dehydrogenase accessory factor